MAFARIPGWLNYYRTVQTGMQDGSHDFVALFVRTGDELAALGVDVFALEWAAASVGRRTFVEALVRRGMPGPGMTTDWTDGDRGAVAVALRASAAAAAAVILRVAETRDPAAFGEYFEARAALTGSDMPAAVARLLWAGVDLAARGVDVFALEWMAASAAQQASVDALVFWTMPGSESTAGWTEREPGAVAVALRASEAAAAATVRQLANRSLATLQQPQRPPLVTPSDADRLAARQAVRLAAARRAADPDGRQSSARTEKLAAAFEEYYRARGDVDKADDADKARVAKAARAAARRVEAPHVAAARLVEAGHALSAEGVDVFAVAWQGLQGSEEEADVKTLVAGWLPAGSSTDWTGREWGAVAVARRAGEKAAIAVAAGARKKAAAADVRRAGEDLAAATTWRVAADRAGLPVRDISSLRAATRRELGDMRWEGAVDVNDAMVARYYATLTQEEAGTNERAVAFAIAGRIANHGQPFLGLPGGAARLKTLSDAGGGGRRRGAGIPTVSTPDIDIDIPNLDDLEVPKPDASNVPTASGSPDTGSSGQAPRSEAGTVTSGTQGPTDSGATGPAQNTAASSRNGGTGTGTVTATTSGTIEDRPQGMTGSVPGQSTSNSDVRHATPIPTHVGAGSKTDQRAAEAAEPGGSDAHVMGRTNVSSVSIQDTSAGLPGFEDTSELDHGTGSSHALAASSPVSMQSGLPHTLTSVNNPATVTGSAGNIPVSIGDTTPAPEPAAANAILTGAVPSGPMTGQPQTSSDPGNRLHTPSAVTKPAAMETTTPLRTLPSTEQFTAPKPRTGSMPQHDTESPPHFTLTTNNDLSPQTIHLENSEPLSTQGITAANSDHANGLTVAASGGPNHTSDNVHGTTDDDATLFGAPDDDVFPAEWGVVRGLAPARRVERSWVDPVSEPAGGGAHARRFEVRSGFDVRKFEVGGQSVSDVTVRVRLVGGDQLPAAVDALWDRAVGGVERVFNRPGAVLPDGSVLHVTLERVTGNASDAHLNVNVGGPRGAMDQYEWSIDATELDLAHELGHQLGLRDEYQETGAEHRPEVDGSLMGNYHNTAPDGLPQGGLRDRYLQLIHAQIGSHDDLPVGDVVRAGSEGDMTSRSLAPHAPGEERQGRQIAESDLTDRMRRWLDRPATMNRFVQVKHLAGLRYTGQPNWTPETLVSIGSLNLDYADRARLILRVPGLNDELAAALHKRLDDVDSAPPRVLVQPGYASGDQFGIAAALIVDPHLHVVLVSDVGGKPDSSGAVADFYQRSGISPSRVHRITANKGQSAQEASRKTVNSLLDVISPGLSSSQKLERTLEVREGTKWVARNFTVGVRRTLRRAWEIDDVGFPPRVQEYVRTWLTVQQAVPSPQQDTIVLWSRFSGKQGYAHPEHDTSFEGMRQILRRLAERAKERGERPLVVIAGDAYSDPKHAKKYEDIAEKARKDGLNVRNLTNFWKGSKTSLRAWGGDNRVGQFRLYEYLNRHSRSVRHLGFRSGNLEAMALIGHTVMYLEERGAPSAWRMEQWHAAENSLRTRDRALAVGYERILIEEPPTRTGKVITRWRETAARMAPNDPARNQLPDFKDPPWIFGALHRQPKPPKLFKDTDKGFYQDDLQKIADYLLPRQVPAAPAPPGRAAVRAPRLENVPVRPDGPDHLDGGGLAMQAAMWADAAQQRAADVQRWAAERTGAQRDAANAAQQAARARQEAADNRRKAKGWEESLRQAQAKEREAAQQAKTAEEMAVGWQRAVQAGRATELQAVHQQALARQLKLAARQAQRAAQHQAVVAAQYQWLAEQRAAVEDQVLQRALAEQRAAEQRAAEAQKEEQRALAEQRAAEAQRDEKRAAEKRAAEKRAAEKKPAEKKPAEKKPAEKKPAEKKPAPRRKPTYRDGDFSDTDEVENLVPDDRSFFGDMENEVPAEHIQWALAQHPGRRTTAEPQPVVGFGKSRFGLRTDKLPVSRSERFRTLRYRTDTEPLYRYDTRHYDTIFNEGFHPWNGKRVRSLAHYQSYVQRTAMVSASRSGGEYLPEWAAAADGTAYLYVIHAPGGIDMVESLQRRARYPMQEVVFWKGIRPEFIDRVELVRKPPNQRYPEVLRVISRGDWENEFETGGRTLQDGSWRGPSGLKLTVDANRLASDLAVRSYQLEPRITLEVQSCTKNVKHLKFSSDVKTAASLKRKLAKQLLENPGVAAQDAVNGFGDAVRYTVTVTRFDKYAKRVGEIAKELRSRGYTLISHRNSWGSPGYRGINTVWHDRKNRINFEIQFHTVRSREAREAAHIFYEKMRIPGLDQAKQKEYAEEMRKIFHTVPLPEGVFTIEWMASGGEGA
ncbi:hypothetical protein PV350_38855 [Streptomyces sp. PA03-6a]|nr:hypothetical protein [Streptomyces sp. PA03-6a]